MIHSSHIISAISLARLIIIISGEQDENSNAYINYTTHRDLKLECLLIALAPFLLDSLSHRAPHHRDNALFTTDFGCLKFH